MYGWVAARQALGAGRRPAPEGFESGLLVLFTDCGLGSTLHDRS